MFKKSLMLIMTLFAVQTAVAADCPKVLNSSLNDLNGEPINFCDYQGKVILAVNTASRCGNTPQYEALEALFQKYNEKDFVVVGFPANNFGNQEPGSNEDIQEFCKLNYGVSFPMVAKTDVVGNNTNPVFTELEAMTGEIPRWNFHKYLISRDGESAYSFTASMSPMNAKIVSQLEALLEE